MHKYRLTPSAKSDLIEIWNYTVETWGEIIFYLNSGLHIDIIGILHGKMDIDKNLM